MRSSRIAVVILTFGLIFGASVAPASAAESLTVFDVPGTSGNIGTQASGINSRGDIVGVYVTNGLNTHGFLLHNGRFTTIDAPGASFPAPPTSGGTGAAGINSQGDIVGSFNDSGGNIHGFVLKDGNFSTIDAPGSNFTAPTGSNSRGDIVGSFFDSGGHRAGFLLSHGQFSTIDIPGAMQTAPSGINAKGEIVGSYFDSSFASHGFLLRRGALAIIDVPGGTAGSTQAFGINAQGDVVGSFGDSQNYGSNWLLSKGSYTAPITEEFNPHTCDCSAFPSGINDRGDIVGAYFDANGIHGFLLRT